jgi:hypothetical protein
VRHIVLTGSCLVSCEFEVREEGFWFSPTNFGTGICQAV